MNLESKILMNTHKIEKALSMPNRYKVFSQDIVKELMYDCTLVGVEQDIINYALSTILKYRNSLDSSILENEYIIEWINSQVKLDGFDIKHVSNGLVQCQERSLMDVALNRHSVRNFSDKCVPIESIKKALLVANSLPSACNRQACSIKIIDNKSLREKLLLLQTGNKGIIAPVLGVIVGNAEVFTQDNEEKALHYHGGMFSAGFVLGLESLGLSSCILNWHVDSEINKMAKDLLGLDKKAEIISFIFIGFAMLGKQEAYSYKKNISGLIEIIE